MGDMISLNNEIQENNDNAIFRMMSDTSIYLACQWAQEKHI